MYYYYDEHSAEDERGYYCRGPDTPFDPRDWYLHERHHQAVEGLYRNVQLLANRRHPTVMTVTMEHLCPITCFIDDRDYRRRQLDDEKVSMTCHVASLQIFDYMSLPPQEDELVPHAEYVEKFRAVFDQKKVQIQEEVTRVKDERPDVQDMNVNCRLVMARTSLARPRRDAITAMHTLGITTRNLDDVEQLVGQLVDDCVDYLVEYIEQCCQQVSEEEDVGASFTLVV